MATFPRKKIAVVLAAVFGVLIVAIVGALFVLDSIILKEARIRAQVLSAELGRPISIGGVSIKLLDGLSVRVSGIEVGAGPDERLPLLQLESAQVRASLLRALLSGGKEIEIHSLNFKSVALNVIRFSDGTTNVERAVSKFQAAEGVPGGPPAPPSESPKMPHVKLAQFRFTDGRIRFHDQSGSGASAPDLEISHLDVSLDNFEPGRSAELQIRAALLADRQNAELRFGTAPIPDSLKPTVTRAVIKIQPVDLRPLAPYFPSSVGLKEGKISADFTSDLGAAAPGGSGETRLQGKIQAEGLRFAEMEGGTPLSASIDTDVRGDAQKGDLQLDRLRIAAGPALLTGKGRVVGLNSAHPRIEGLEIIGRDLDPAKFAELYPPFKRELKGQVAGPVGLEIRGAGTPVAPSVEIKLDFTPVRISVPQTLEKSPGNSMTVLAHLLGGDGAGLKFDVKADLAGVDLRPGKSVDKAPGQPFELFVAGSKPSGGGSKAALKIELAKLVARVRDSTLSGKGWLERTDSGPNARTQFELALDSPRLDLDQMLLPTPKTGAVPKTGAAPKTAAKSLPASQRSAWAGLKGHATAKIAWLRKSGTEMTNVLADATLNEGELLIQTLSANAFGGKLVANGTRVGLGQTEMPFTMVAKLEHIDVAQALALGTDKKVLSGAFDGEVSFTGKGVDTEALKKALTGSLHGDLREGQLLSKDLIASVSEPLAKALPAGIAHFKGNPDGITSLGKALTLGVTVENGLAKLKAPVKWSRPEGDVALGGGMRLDGNLDLAGTIELSPQTIASLTNGKVKLTGPVPIGLKIGGPAWKPVVSGLDLSGAVSAIGKQAAAGAVGRLLGSKAAGALGSGAKPGEAVQQQAGDAAKESVDNAAKKAEEDVKRKLKGLFGK